VPLKVFDKSCFLQLWRAVLPPFYTESIESEDEGAGLDVPSAQGAQFAKVEEGANLSQQAYYLRPHSTQTGPIASSGVKASGEVLLRRAAPALGSIVFPAGSVLIAQATDSYGGELFLGRYLTTAEVVVADGSSGPLTVPVAAEFTGYTGNLDPNYIVGFEPQGRLEVPSVVLTTVRFQRVAQVGVVNDLYRADLVDRYVRLVGNTLVSPNRTTPRRVTAVFVDGLGQLGIEVDLPLDAADLGKPLVVEVEEYADLGFTVEQPTAIAGGVDDALGAIGVDRRQGKVPGESDEAFRQRLLLLVDNVSPNAILRMLDRILTPAGIGFELLETLDIDGLMGFTWSVHPWGFGQVCPPIAKIPGSEYVGQGGVWTGPSTGHHFFVVCVTPSGLGDFSGMWGDFNPPGYPNAWGLMAWGGFAAGYLSLVAQVWEAIDQARAAGVGFWIIEDGSF
jgi:hypothetical protein